MTRGWNRSRGMMWSLTLPFTVVAAGVVAVLTTSRSGPGLDVDQATILRGRALVIEHACGGCHGGVDPSSDGWLTGWTGKAPPEVQDFQVGPFHTYARNLTPDNVTGLGRFTERQLFNALRYGLRPGETPDVEITSATPGQGNFPRFPKYLAPPMPWTAWRHMPDDDLWAIAAYLKQGVKPVENPVKDSEGPPDFWAGFYVPDSVGAYPAPPFPTAREQEPPAGVDRAQVLRGRQVVLQHDCGGCHGGFSNPAAPNFLIGVTAPEQAFVVGPCAADPSGPCFHLRPRNLTPDDETGIGRYTARQIFNAIRFGLQPSATPDVEITSSTPGQGNYPAHPQYVNVAMPWYYWRHMSDADLWAMAAYLEHGLKPVKNRVEPSDAPPDFWASEYTPEKISTYPAPPFPTAHETGG